MTILESKDVINIMREEWAARVQRLVEKTAELKLNAPAAKTDGKSLILAPELKVMHKTSGIRYTIDSVGLENVILRTPEDEKFLVDQKELESEYELD